MGINWTDLEDHKYNLIVGDTEFATESIVTQMVNEHSKRIVLLADSEDLISLYFTRIRNRLVSCNSTYAIERDHYRPFYEIGLNNKSMIRGFVIGKNGHVGQSAELIYVMCSDKTEQKAESDAVYIKAGVFNSKILFFFKDKSAPLFKTLSKNSMYKIHNNTSDNDGMITNPITGRKSWL